MEDAVARSQLIKAVRHLSLPFDQQLEVVRGAHVDELALDFDGIYPAVKWRFAEVGVSPSAQFLLSSLNDRLLAMSGHAHADLWTSTGLEFAKEWQVVRNIAAQVLVDLAPQASL
jgi:hypothetical protein